MSNRNVNWKLPEAGHTYDSAQLSVLMDIRDRLDQLQQMNQRLSVLQCSNFLQIPQVLRAIRKNTTKRRKKPERAR